MIDNVNFHDLAPQKYWSFPSTWSMERRKQEFHTRVFSNEWIGSQKHDGAFYKFVKDSDGSMELLGRSKGVGGDYLNKLDWVPQLHPFFEKLPNGTCILGEIYFPNNEGSRNVTTIMGCLLDKALSRQSVGDKLHYFIFDILAYDGKSLLNASAADRFALITELSTQFNEEYIHFAEYFTGGQIQTKLQSLLADGYEGMVLIKANSKYEPDKRPSKTTLKCKKELSDTLDVFFTGRATAPTHEYVGKELETWKYWEHIVSGEKLEGEYYGTHLYTDSIIRPVTKSWFYGFAGSLEIGVMRDKKVYPVGFLSGLTEEIKGNYKDYANKCIEVSAMEQDPETGALRHGKMIGFRPDLTPADCTWEKFIHIG